VRDLCAAAVDVATGAGAEYADARAVVRRSQRISTKNGRVEQLTDTESEGIGVRVLVNGAWGFACDHRLTADGARDAALRACAFARATGGRGKRALAPVDARTGTYRTSFERDPFSVSIADKVAHCLRAEEALSGPDIIVRQASVRALREHKILLSSEGTDVEQEFVECGGGLDCAASGNGIYQLRSYPSASVGMSQQRGWEFVEQLGLEREAPRVAEQASALLRAEPCPSKVTTLVLDSDQTALQVHESVGHPTELDRVYGTEASYAGTSFLKPDDLGSLRYGSELMNITADSTTPGGLGSFGFDDEGVPASQEAIVKAGVLTGFLTSRETAARIGSGAGGSMRADGWNRMPLVRMTNLHLDPGEGTLDDLLADVDDGIYMETNKSWSIDDKLTPEFWGKLDAVAGADAWQMQGITNCGKGQPGQGAHVSHGASPARFRDVQVGVKA
jgi:TldD protein